MIKYKQYSYQAVAYKLVQNNRVLLSIPLLVQAVFCLLILYDYSP